MIETNEIIRLLPHGPQRDILIFDSLPSTNDKAKELAREGAPGGTVVIALRQTAGRGRMGRSFFSPDGGLYVSALYRPDTSAADLAPLTAFAAVAVCGAIESLTGSRPASKWPNDIISRGEKKLCGILAEMSLCPSGEVRSIIIGIGVNVGQPAFPPELEKTAASLKLEYGVSPPLAALCAAIIERLDGAVSACADERRDLWLRMYRENCVTVGKNVALTRGDTVKTGTAIGIDNNAALIVRFDDGAVEAVSCGEALLHKDTVPGHPDAAHWNGSK